VEGPWVPLMLGDAPSLLEHLESNLKSNEFSKLSLAVRLRVIACPGSGRHPVSIGNQDEALLNVIRGSPFTTAVNAANTSLFPGSIRTVRELRNRASARKIGLTPRHKEARIGFALEHLARDEAFWSSVVFSDEKVFQSCPNGRLRARFQVRVTNRWCSANV
jgi:hypothetical protein